MLKSISMVGTKSKITKKKNRVKIKKNVGRKILMEIKSMKKKKASKSIQHFAISVLIYNSKNESNCKKM